MFPSKYTKLLTCVKLLSTALPDGNPLPGLGSSENARGCWIINVCRGSVVTGCPIQLYMTCIFLLSDWRKCEGDVRAIHNTQSERYTYAVLFLYDTAVLQ
jgi:hypothetical protein